MLPALAIDGGPQPTSRSLAFAGISGNALVPTAVVGGLDWDFIGSTNSGSFAIRGGDLYTWGSNGMYELGIGQPWTPTPVRWD